MPRKWSFTPGNFVGFSSGVDILEPLKIIYRVDIPYYYSMGNPGS